MVVLCLEFAIPPLPQFVTAGHAVWKPGDRHFARTFGVYDLAGHKGTLYMREEQTEYEVGAGKRWCWKRAPHVGHRACSEHTEIYWVHFIHGHPAVHILQEDIPWTSLLSKGTVEDVEPSSRQRMYLPKFASVEVQTVEPIARIERYPQQTEWRKCATAPPLLTELFAARRQARSDVRAGAFRPAGPSAAYLNEHWKEPFERASLEEKLHFQASYIARCMKMHIGKTPLQYVLYLRLEEAKKLLGGTVLGISEIAERVGIRDSNYMTRLFSAKLGMTPGAYRQMLRQKKESGGNALPGQP